MVLGLDKDSYLEYDNVMEFYNWILSLKPKDVRDEGISQQALYKIKTKIKNGNILTTAKRNLLSAKISIFLLNFLLHEKILSAHYSVLPESFCGQCPPGHKFIGDLYFESDQPAFSSTEHACVC